MSQPSNNPQELPRSEAVQHQEDLRTSGETGDSDAIMRRLAGAEHGDDALDRALEDKLLEDGLNKAKGTAEIARALSPHQP